jgi:hypothetical protein
MASSFYRELSLSDNESGKPMQVDTVFSLESMTKNRDRGQTKQVCKKSTATIFG